ncbi:MAG: hypothetical protein IKZ44_03430 [Clostridia bacterium]|nr:hypothetical protein [Clostridia bacterium]
MKNSRMVYLIVSILLLFNALFLPICAAPSWAMSETGTTLGFYNAMYMLVQIPNPLEYWLVSLTLAIFVPSLSLFITALIGKQIPYLISALAGITLWAVVTWNYVQQFGFADLFVLDGTRIGIGFWCAIVLLIIAAVFGIRGKDRNS